MGKGIGCRVGAFLGRRGGGRGSPPAALLPGHSGRHFVSGVAFQHFPHTGLPGTHTGSYQYASVGNLDRHIRPDGSNID